jgi:hypothetical protein
MKVRELIVLLSEADPEDIIMLEPVKGDLVLIKRQPGMHQPLVEDIPGTAVEEEFLRAMHIQW